MFRIKVKTFENWNHFNLRWWNAHLTTKPLFDRSCDSFPSLRQQVRQHVRQLSFCQKQLLFFACRLILCLDCFSFRYRLLYFKEWLACFFQPLVQPLRFVMFDVIFRAVFSCSGTALAHFWYLTSSLCLQMCFMSKFRCLSSLSCLQSSIACQVCLACSQVSLVFVESWSNSWFSLSQFEVCCRSLFYLFMRLPKGTNFNHGMNV